MVPDSYWRAEDRGYVTPCHIWQRGTSDGRPVWYRPGRSDFAHRSIFEDVTGVRLPPSVHVHHKCEVKMCIRWDHMEPLGRVAHGRQHIGNPTGIGGSPAKPKPPKPPRRPPTPKRQSNPNPIPPPWRARAAAAAADPEVE